MADPTTKPPLPTPAPPQQPLPRHRAPRPRRLRAHPPRLPAIASRSRLGGAILRHHRRRQHRHPGARLRCGARWPP
uniref:Uncharacterized protein n=1 Tax=Arundo donax TaxID=35708 RepID=A0A0A8XU12_ARUDO